MVGRWRSRRASADCSIFALRFLPLSFGHLPPVGGDRAFGWGGESLFPSCDGEPSSSSTLVGLNGFSGLSGLSGRVTIQTIETKMTISTSQSPCAVFPA